MQPRAVTLLAGLSLMVPATVAVLFYPRRLYTPLPLLVWVPIYRLGIPDIFAPMLLFFLWNPALFRGSPKFPNRTYVLFFLLVIVSMGWFIFSWKWGIQFQGRNYTGTIFVINVIWIAGLFVALWRSRRAAASFASNVVVHWAIFLWLAWCAFPVLGELP
jgi:hypothetical protein